MARRGIRGAAKPARAVSLSPRAPRVDEPDVDRSIKQPVEAAPIMPPVPAASARPMKEPPLGSVDIASLSGQALKDYATRAGVPKRDIEALSEDRLRQNTMLFIANHFELIEEGF